MHANGHYGAALLAYAPIGYRMVGNDPALAALGGFVVVGLATLPDIDLRLSGVPHRGPTHSLFFLGGVAWALGAATNWLGLPTVSPLSGMPSVEFGVLIGLVGVGSHLLADVITPAGLNVLWPLPLPTLSLSLTEAGNQVANFGLLVIGIAASGTALWLGV